MFDAARHLRSACLPVMNRASRCRLAVVIAAIAVIAGHDALMAGLPQGSTVPHAEAGHHGAPESDEPAHPDDCWTSREAAVPGHRAPHGAIAAAAVVILEAPPVEPALPSVAGPDPAPNRAPPRAVLQVWRV
jgi:hypothetical protein